LVPKLSKQPLRVIQLHELPHSFSDFLDVSEDPGVEDLFLQGSEPLFNSICLGLLNQPKTVLDAQVGYLLEEVV
jgi:hypothetical protein